MSFVVKDGVRIYVTGKEESKTQRDDPTHSGGRDRTAHSGGAAALVADTPTGATPGATEGAMLTPTDIFKTREMREGFRFT